MSCGVGRVSRKSSTSAYARGVSVPWASERGESFCLRGDRLDQQGQEGRPAVLERLEPLHEFIWHI